jgi:4,5-DOPA dioxygenase extradiol
MPALFIGHGSPMNTLELNDFTRHWRRMGEHAPRPRALLVVSAHWFFGATAVSAMPRPRTIHDFYGFPQALFDFDYLALGARLAPLRDRGVMIVASGNVVHNLRRIQWNESDAGFDWARCFDDAVARQLADGPADILRVTGHADYDLAVPTPDHFIPLLYLAGLAGAGGQARPLVRGYALGSLSMTCFGIGLDEIECRRGEGSAPLPVGVPADQTNA